MKFFRFLRRRGWVAALASFAMIVSMLSGIAPESKPKISKAASTITAQDRIDFQKFGIEYGPVENCNPTFLLAFDNSFLSIPRVQRTGDIVRGTDDILVAMNFSQRFGENALILFSVKSAYEVPSYAGAVKFASGCTIYLSSVRNMTFTGADVYFEDGVKFDSYEVDTKDSYLDLASSTSTFVGKNIIYLNDNVRDIRIRRRSCGVMRSGSIAFTAENINVGQTLGDAKIKASNVNWTADVPGTWEFVDADTVPEVGAHKYDVRFVPENELAYETVTYENAGEITVVDPTAIDSGSGSGSTGGTSGGGGADSGSGNSGTGSGVDSGGGSGSGSTGSVDSGSGISGTGSGSSSGGSSGTGSSSSGNGAGASTGGSSGSGSSGTSGSGASASSGGSSGSGSSGTSGSGSSSGNGNSGAGSSSSSGGDGSGTGEDPLASASPEPSPSANPDEVAEASPEPSDDPSLSGKEDSGIDETEPIVNIVIEPSTISKAATVKAAKIKSAKRSGNKLTITVKKASGVKYQIQYTTKKNSWSKAKKVSFSTSKKVIKKLKRNKRYYYRIRAYKKINGKTVYSKWSKRKKC